VKSDPKTFTYRVCFVCTGNICRSPMAEWVLKARLRQEGLDSRVGVDSAGTGDWHVGDHADPRTVKVLARHGYPSRHTARHFRRADLTSRDLVLALDGGHLRTLRRWSEEVAAKNRTAQHPARADAVRLEPALAQLRLLREFDPAADPRRLDVPDPYYGSLADFEECLAMVEAAMPGLPAHIRTALETRGQ
jgi:protein-tyrosine phosphatase